MAPARMSFARHVMIFNHWITIQQQPKRLSCLRLTPNSAILTPPRKTPVPTRTTAAVGWATRTPPAAPKRTSQVPWNRLRVSSLVHQKNRMLIFDWTLFLSKYLEHIVTPVITSIDHQITQSWCQSVGGRCLAYRIGDWVTIRYRLKKLDQISVTQSQTTGQNYSTQFNALLSI